VNRVWCEHCDGEFSETGTVGLGNGDDVVPVGKRNAYLYGDICIDCMEAYRAWELEESNECAARKKV